MSALRLTLRLRRDEVLVIAPSTLLTEAVLVASVAVLVVALRAPAPGQRTWPSLVFVAAAAAAAVLPDSPAALLALGWYAGAWLLLTPETSASLAWAVPAAIAATCFHATLALLAGVPPGADVEPRAALGLLARFGAAGAAAVAVALPVPLSRGALLPDAAAGVLLLALAALPRLASGRIRE